MDLQVFRLENLSYPTRLVSQLSQTDPGVVEFFKLLLAVLQVLNEGVLDEKKAGDRVKPNV